MSAPKTQANFPFLPDYMTWEEWNGNFVIYYGQEPVSISPEEDWQTTAIQIMNLPTFSAYPIPGPETFLNWQDWAQDLAATINGPSR